MPGTGSSRGEAPETTHRLPNPGKERRPAHRSGFRNTNPVIGDCAEGSDGCQLAGV